MTYSAFCYHFQCQCCSCQNPFMRALPVCVQLISCVTFHGNLNRNIPIRSSTYSKIKFHPGRGHDGPEGEQWYSSTLSLTWELDGGGCLTPHPGRFTPGKEAQYSFHRRLVGLQGRSGRVRKISPPPGFDLRTVQSVPSRYTAELYSYCDSPFGNNFINVCVVEVCVPFLIFQHYFSYYYLP